MEKKILKIISESFPFPFKQVERLYKDCNSFDKTISILRSSLAMGVSVLDYDEFRKIRNKKKYGNNN